MLFRMRSSVVAHLQCWFSKRQNVTTTVRGPGWRRSPPRRSGCRRDLRADKSACDDPIQRVKQRGVEIVNTHDVLNGTITKIIRGAMDVAFLETATRNPERKA